MHRIAAAGAAATALAAVAVLPLATTAAPTCPQPATRPACGNRVVPEPLSTATFLQYGTEVFPALEAIEALAPDLIDVATLDELTGNAEHVSAGGRKLPVVRVTDEAATGPKRQVVFSLSVHGTEPAGREGGIRYLEDLARWWAADDTDRLLYTGDTGVPLGELMAATEVWFGFTNPDGWAAGDLGSGSLVFARGNDNDEDLNREFPTIGWTNTAATPMSEPEAQGWVEFVRGLGPIATTSDIHGELTSANDAFADLMWPAGQWTPTMQARELQLGLNVVRSIERKFAEDGVVLGELTGTTETMQPAAVATGYDVVGYDDGGFMGDWLTQATGAVDIDAENFLSHIVPGNIWIGPLEQAHVAAVRGIVEAVIAESAISHLVRPELDLGRVGYVFDPRRVTSADGSPGEARRPYDVSRLRYFEDLERDAGVPVDALDPADVASGDARLSAYDTVVLADVALPPDRSGRRVDPAAYAEALRRFVTAGGQLVLTDGAMPLLAQFGFTDENDLRFVETNAGHVDFGPRDHEWEQDLVATASQTYYEVPLGFAPRNQAPHHGVATDRWEEAGGTTVGTVGSGDAAFTALGELPVGAGKVSVFGALLPTPTEENDHVEGLADYGVTIAGGQVFHRMLAYRRPGGTGPAAPPPADPPPARDRRPPPRRLATTGGDLAEPALLLGVLVVAAATRRRLRRG